MDSPIISSLLQRGFSKLFTGSWLLALYKIKHGCVLIYRITQNLRFNQRMLHNAAPMKHSPYFLDSLCFTLKAMTVQMLK